MQNNYLERVYAGFLGMNVGIRLGAPVEPNIWSYERIKETYGDIRGYVKDYINFAADDDANGPVYFFRALRDSSKNGELTPEYVAKAWLNYAREGIGMFWWGGYGVSTEHTAYLNLLHGIPAPLSGSAATNGKLLSDQIGGQIFIDTWGLVWPGQPTKAADYAQAAASVSHDGEGLYGARFIAAAIAEAFVETDVAQIVERALQEIPADSLYAAVTKAVIAHHAEHPNDWESCLMMLHRDWGYDTYGGGCHIIPNAGVRALALLYGAGDFPRTVEIATMCSWDTDCNAGNVGTILGVMTGLEGIGAHYRKPINDGIVLSGITGYLNILDLPTYAKELARTGYALAGEEIPTDYSCGIADGAQMISTLGPNCAEGTQEAVDAAWAGIADGSLKVFDTSKFTVGGETVTTAFGLDTDGDWVNDTGECIVDGAFQESVLRSAPYFSLRIDGITELNNN